MPPRIRIRSVGRPFAELRGEGMGERVGKVRRGRGPRGGNDECVDELNGQGNNKVEGANGNVEGVGNQGNVGSQNVNVVNESVQENVRNVLVNSNRVCCSYKEFLACNPKEYDGSGLEWWREWVMEWWCSWVAGMVESEVIRDGEKKGKDEHYVQTGDMGDRFKDLS
nr:hypothetical protein [Tanacetum cinerariifolium]